MSLPVHVRRAHAELDLRSRGNRREQRWPARPAEPRDIEWTHAGFRARIAGQSVLVTGTRVDLWGTPLVVSAQLKAVLLIEGHGNRGRVHFFNGEHLGHTDDFLGDRREFAELWWVMDHLADRVQEHLGDLGDVPEALDRLRPR